MNTHEYPLAYHITWTTYGTWLPGDERGWVKKGSSAILAPDPELRAAAQSAMTDSAIVLSQAQREMIDAVIVKHCGIRKWLLHARNVRTNHIHVIISAAVDGEVIRAQLKAWCSRRLSEHAGLSGKGENGLRRWFSENGDIRWIDGEEHLHNSISYVNEQQ